LMGKIYLAQKMDRTAIYLFTIAFEGFHFLQGIASSCEKGSLLKNLGRCYVNIADLDRAWYYTDAGFFLFLEKGVIKTLGVSAGMGGGRPQPQMAHILVDLSRLHRIVGEVESSQQLLSWSRMILEAAYGNDLHIDFVELLYEEANLYAQLNNFKSAIDCMLSIFKILKQFLGFRPHIWHVKSHKKLAKLYLKDENVACASFHIQEAVLKASEMPSPAINCRKILDKCHQITSLAAQSSQSSASSSPPVSPPNSKVNLSPKEVADWEVLSEAKKEQALLTFQEIFPLLPDYSQLPLEL
jgi:tetratricopeptide (TPR) repeat protein